MRLLGATRVAGRAGNTLQRAKPHERCRGASAERLVDRGKTEGYSDSDRVAQVRIGTV